MRFGKPCERFQMSLIMSGRSHCEELEVGVSQDHSTCARRSRVAFILVPQFVDVDVLCCLLAYAT